MKAECPSCGKMIEVKSPHLGQVVYCPNCDARLEVVWLDPLELDWPVDEDEDIEDDEEF